MKITINGNDAATIQTGQQGFNKTYEFKVVPRPNGGEISVTYGIVRRNS